MGGGRAPGGVFAILIFGSLGLLSIALAAPAEVPGARVAQLASIPLTDDDGGRALFPAAALGPGRPVSRCVQIQYDGPASPGDVFLLAEDVTGTLASRLDVRVERGTGGGFASCAGFAGSEVFRGPLTDLAAGSAGPAGVSTGWVPGAADSQTYRITVELAAGATSGQTTTATFRWLIVSSASPAGPDPTTPAPEPAAVPTAVPSAPSTRRPGLPGVAPAPHPPGGDSHSPNRTGKRTPSKVIGEIVEQTAEVVYKVASGTARHSGVPIASIAAVVIFLLIQNRIDRRDPKLALAPVIGDPYLSFDRDQRADRAGPGAPTGGDEIIAQHQPGGET